MTKKGQQYNKFTDCLIHITLLNKNRIYILFKNLIDGYNIRLPITEERMNELKKVKGRCKEEKKKTFEDTKESSKIQSTWWNGLI